MTVTGKLRVKFTSDGAGTFYAGVWFEPEDGSEPILLGEDYTVYDGMSLVVSPVCLECQASAEVTTEDTPEPTSAKAEAAKPADASGASASAPAPAAGGRPAPATRRRG